MAKGEQRILTGQRQLELLRLPSVTDDLIQFILEAIKVFKRKRNVTRLGCV